LYSAWYGDDNTGTYNTGGPNAGALTTRDSIEVPASAISVTVSFWSWEETEQSGPLGCSPPPALCDRDVRRLQISGTITPTWRTVWSTAFTPTVEREWHQVVADISGYRGQAVKLRFAFRTVNGLLNNFEGWYLDDIAMVAHGVQVPGYDPTDAWVQTFDEDLSDSTPGQDVYVDRVMAAGVTSWQVTDDGDIHSYAAVAAHPVGDMPVAWSHHYTNTHGVAVADVEYAALRPSGSTSIPLTKVSDNSGATFPSVEDRYPTVAVNPTDGSTVIAWTRCFSCPVSYVTRIYDAYYAIFDTSGDPVAGPVALSHNIDNRVRDYETAVEAFPNGNVLIAWKHSDTDTSVRDVYYTVVDASGNTVRAVDNLSMSPGMPYGVSLTRLAGGDILVTWMDSTESEIIFAVIDPSGNVAKAPTELTNYGENGGWGWYPEAVGLTGGSSVVAWTELNDDGTAGQIAYAVLSPSYTVLKPPTLLSNPYNPTIGGYISMATDQEGGAVLTWVPIGYPYLHLYYARLDHLGNVLAGPTIYRQARGGEIHASWFGYGVGELPPYNPVYLPFVPKGFP
jgi:hypothetical protein